MNIIRLILLNYLCLDMTSSVVTCEEEILVSIQDLLSLNAWISRGSM